MIYDYIYVCANDNTIKRFSILWRKSGCGYKAVLCVCQDILSILVHFCAVAEVLKSKEPIPLWSLYDILVSRYALCHFIIYHAKSQISWKSNTTPALNYSHTMWNIIQIHCKNDVKQIQIQVYEYPSDIASFSMLCVLTVSQGSSAQETRLLKGIMGFWIRSRLCVG